MHRLYRQEVLVKSKDQNLNQEIRIPPWRRRQCRQTQSQFCQPRLLIKACWDVCAISVTSRPLLADRHCFIIQGKASLLGQDLKHTRGLLQDPQREQQRARSFVCSLSSWQVEPGSALHVQLIRQLEKQLKVGRACVQAENRWLKEKCSQLEATTEILAQHNQNLQEELHQVRQVLDVRDAAIFFSFIKLVELYFNYERR